MKRPLLNPVARIAIGLIGLVVSIILFASFLGIFPDQTAEVIRQRESLCESVGVSFSMMATKVDLPEIEQYLEQVMARYPDVHSIGLRKADGMELTEIGDHFAQWTREGESSTPDAISIPIYGEQGIWGRLEFRFKPLLTPGWRGHFDRADIRLALLMGGFGFLVFYIYLRFVLKQLTPSRAIPNRVRNALDTLAEGLVIVDRRERIVLANKSFQVAIGVSLDDIIGKQISDLQIAFRHEGHHLGAMPWQTSLNEEISVRGILMTINRSSEGPPVVFSVSCGPIRDSKNKVQGVIASFEDVTQLEEKKVELERSLFDLDASANKIRQQNKELEFLATRDPLTGCMNRRSYFEKFDTHFEQAKSKGEPLAAFMVDIDHFKSINDNHGHAVGDDVLKSVAQTLELAVREQDIVCRYGGEEFSVLLPRTDMDTAADIAETIRHSIEQLVPAGINVTTSVGLSAMCRSPESPQDLLEHADKCLYVAKRNGRNQVVRYDQVPEDIEVDESKISRTKCVVDDQPDRIPFHAVTALISALAFRDQETANHCRRVADLCVAVAEGLLSMKDCYVLEIAGLLHDIGKIGVPDSILLKPGQLTNEEWQELRVHERTGLELINTSFNCRDLDAVLAGYHLPHSQRKIDQRNIPIAARILKIVDAFDSMTSDKPYRKGLGQWETFAELRKYAGVQFDAEMVERVIQVIKMRNKSEVKPVEMSKAAALSVGLQLERLALALDDRDREGIGAIAQRIQQSAVQHGSAQISEKANELASGVEQHADLYEIIRNTNELMDLCRSAQGVLLQCTPVRPEDLELERLDE